MRAFYGNGVIYAKRVREIMKELGYASSSYGTRYLHDSFFLDLSKWYILVPGEMLRYPDRIVMQAYDGDRCNDRTRDWQPSDGGPGVELMSGNSIAIREKKRGYWFCGHSRRDIDVCCAFCLSLYDDEILD